MIVLLAFPDADPDETKWMLILFRLDDRKIVSYPDSDLDAK